MPRNLFNLFWIKNQAEESFENNLALFELDLSVAVDLKLNLTFMSSIILASFCSKCCYIRNNMIFYTSIYYNK